MIYAWDSCSNISLLDDRVIWWNKDYIIPELVGAGIWILLAVTVIWALGLLSLSKG